MYVRISLYASKYLYLSLSDENKPELRTFKLKKTTKSQQLHSVPCQQQWTLSDLQTTFYNTASNW